MYSLIRISVRATRFFLFFFVQTQQRIANYKLLFFSLIRLVLDSFSLSFFL